MRLKGKPMKKLASILFSILAFCVLHAQSSSKKDMSYADRKAELKSNFLKSVSKNQFGDLLISVPKPNMDDMDKIDGLFGHPFVFLLFFDSDLDMALLAEISEKESEAKKRNFKDKGLAIIDRYLKNWRINLKTCGFKSSEIRRCLDSGQPIFAYLNLRPRNLKEISERQLKRESAQSPDLWVKSLNSFKKIGAEKMKASMHSFIIGYNKKTEEYCIFYAEKIYWITEKELKSVMIDMYFAYIH